MREEFFVLFNIADQPQVDAYLKEIEEKLHADHQKKPTIYFLVYEHGFELREVELEPLDIPDLGLNYGDDFPEIDLRIKEFINSARTGLVLFHGVSGSGKSSYCHYLLPFCRKKVIYLPPQSANLISRADVLPFMLDQGKDSILVIEDAEEVLVERMGTNNSAVSNLLNLTDGILSKALVCKIICTFNAAKTKLDPALVRKGRLQIEHEFGLLKPEHARRLLTQLGFSKQRIDEVQDPMTLADIYNFGVDTGHREKSAKIGFAD